MTIYLIIAQPRSGSTLLRRLLNSHSKIYAPTEPWLFYSFHEMLYGDDIYNKFINNFVGKDEDNLIESCIKLACKTKLKNNNKQIFIEKTPKNIEILDFIKNLNINIKYIVLRRNKYAVINSKLRRGGTIKSIIRARVQQKVFKYIKEYVFYENKIKDLIENEHQETFQLTYEQLVTNPFKILNKLQNWIGVEIEQITEYKDEETILGDLNSKNFSHPHTGSTDKWKQQLFWYEKKLISYLTT